MKNLKFCGLRLVFERRIGPKPSTKMYRPPLVCIFINSSTNIEHMSSPITLPAPLTSQSFHNVEKNKRNQDQFLVKFSSYGLFRLWRRKKNFSLNKWLT